MNNTENIENLLRSLKMEGSASDTFRKNAKIRILNTISSPTHSVPRFFGYTFGAAIATVVLSVGTVYAAQSSRPSSPLYPVKVLSEDVALTLSPTKSIKTTVAQTIISRRVSEVEESKKHGDTREVEKSIQHLNDDVQAIQKREDITKEEIEKVLTPTPVETRTSTEHEND